MRPGGFHTGRQTDRPYPHRFPAYPVSGKRCFPGRSQGGFHGTKNQNGRPGDSQKKPGRGKRRHGSVRVQFNGAYQEIFHTAETGYISF